MTAAASRKSSLKVSVDFNMILAADEPPVFPDDSTPVWAMTDEQVQHNDEDTVQITDEAVLPSNDSAPPAADDQAEPEWAGAAEQLEIPAAEPSAEKPPRTIRIHFEVSDNPDKDRRRLTRIHNELVQFPGQDRFEIVINRQPKPVILKFPDHTTDICAALRRSLIDIVGSEAHISVADE